MGLRQFISVCLMGVSAEISADMEMTGLLQSTVTSEGNLAQILNAQYDTKPVNKYTGVVVFRGANYTPGKHNKCLVTPPGTPMDKNAVGTQLVVGDCTGPDAMWEKNFTNNEAGKRKMFSGLLVHQATGLCLDVKYDDCWNGRPMILWECKSYLETNQDFQFGSKQYHFSLRVKHCKHMCVDVVAGTDFVNVWHCEHKDNQKFHWNEGGFGAKQIKKNKGATSGLLQSTVTSEGKSAQTLKAQHEITPANKYIGQVQYRGNNKCLVPIMDKGALGAKLVLGECKVGGKEVQSSIWEKNFTNNEDGKLQHYSGLLVHQATGLCMDVEHNRCWNGSPFILWPCHRELENTNQDFQFGTDKHDYSLRVKHCNHKCADIVAGTDVVNAWHCEHKDNQKFHWKKLN